MPTFSFQSIDIGIVEISDRFLDSITGIISFYFKMYASLFVTYPNFYMMSCQLELNVWGTLCYCFRDQFPLLDPLSDVDVRYVSRPVLIDNLSSLYTCPTASSFATSDDILLRFSYFKVILNIPIILKPRQSRAIQATLEICVITLLILTDLKIPRYLLRGKKTNQ